MDRVLEYEIPSEYDGANITTVLKQHFKISTNLIKDLKKYKEGIQVNGEHKRVVDLVAKGDILKITIRDTVSENIVPTDIPLDIVYEDEDVLVINKPSNMPTHPSMGNYENSLANGVMYYYKSTVVSKDVPPYTLVGGVPAKPIGKRNDNLNYVFKWAERARYL